MMKRRNTESRVLPWILSLTVMLTGLLAMAGGAAAGEVIRLSEPVEVTETHEVFGAPMAQKDAGLGLADTLGAWDQHAGGPVRVTTRIAKVCQKKGCFFVAQDGDAMARVSFADYGFFIPTDSSGKTVTLIGTLERKPITQAEADHYAEDLGEDAPAPLEQDFEYAIVATSVMIPKT